MSRFLLLLLALATALAGCASDVQTDDAADGAAGAGGDADDLRCADGEVEHPYEDRCLPGADAPHNQRCNVFLGQGATDDRTLFCQATSDGAATAAVSFDGSGTVTVYVRDAGNDLVAEQTFGPGDHVLPAEGEGGRWRLAVDFGDAVGPVVVDLWG